LVIVGAFIFVTLFFLPFENESSTAGYKTLALINMHEAPETNMKKTCELVKVQYKLSPRESEVLEYLVKGRNAKHVAEKLFISESTAKTHISNIYHKLTVHSQQELLDKLDKLCA
ncbi:MAG: response regulator transcription factor, partial [Eggerthellaceae bacterium]|nr:response regulator transcription factor [Eggerthellaceae bacterium]